MSISLPANDWLAVLRKEYLQDFIRSGGAAVKFAVPLENMEHQGLLDTLQQMAEEDGYLFVSVDAAITRVHMIDRLFHAIARQVAWDDLAYAFLRSTLVAGHYRLPDDRKDFTLEQLAELNGLDVPNIQTFINQMLEDRLFKNY